MTRSTSHRWERTIRDSTKSRDPSAEHCDTQWYRNQPRGSREERASLKDCIRVYTKIKPSTDAPLYSKPTLLLDGLGKQRTPWARLTRDASEWAYWTKQLGIGGISQR